MAITRVEAERIESRLSELGFDPDALKDWFMRRIYEADAGGQRITHYHRVRGSHGEMYVWDAQGTDDLPLGSEAPPRPLRAAKDPR